MDIPEILIEDIHYHLHRYNESRTRSNAGYHLNELINKVSDLSTYHSGYSYQNGTLPYERDDTES